MFNVNWPQLQSENTPKRYRAKPVMYEWISTLLSPIISLHQSFLIFRQEALYRSRFTAQIIYLEKRLNDRFDSVNRGIWIDNVADRGWVYIFNQIENRQAIYFYNNYSASVTYQVGEFAQTATGVYKCILISTGNFPDSSTSYWSFHSAAHYFKNLAEYNQIVDYKIMVPVSLVFSQDEMKSIVNYYNLAGKKYSIHTY